MRQQPRGAADRGCPLGRRRRGLPGDHQAPAPTWSPHRDAPLDPGRVAGGSIEVAGDELTGEQVAAAYQRQYGIAARYQALPIDVLGDDDQRAMFDWFAHPPAFRADFAATKALAPRTKTLEQWLLTRPDLEARFT